MSEAGNDGGLDGLARLIAQGLTPPEAVDYIMVQQRGYKQTQWATERGVSQQAVSRNVKQAQEKLLRSAFGNPTETD